MVNSCALLIAVSDYRAYDASAGRPQGSSDLYSPARNQQIAFDWIQDLGFNASATATLSTPLRPCVGVRPGRFGLATRENILDSALAMAHRMAKEGATRGLVHFSGHGGMVPGQGPVLCPSDTVQDGSGLSNYVTLKELVEIFEEHAPGTALTLILDSCGSGVVPMSTQEDLDNALTLSGMREDDVLLSATGPGQLGMELELGGHWFGAFTWALDRALRVYRRRVELNTVFFDTSVHNLVYRAARLIEGLSLAQNPQVTGDAERIFLQPSGTYEVVPSYAPRDGGKDSLQVNEGETGIVTGAEAKTVLYNVLHNGVIAAQVQASYNTPVNPYRELWSVNPKSFTSGTLTFSYVATSPSFPPLSPAWSFNMMAWKKDAQPSDFQNFTIQNGATVWCLYGSGQRQAYMVVQASGEMVWLMEQRAYDGGILPELLASLPMPAGPGGIVLCGPVPLSFQKLNDGNNLLTDVLIAQNVN